MKIYNNDKKKFTGEIYNIFNTKLRVFLWLLRKDRIARYTVL
jgi:hypothetical protein